MLDLFDAEAPARTYGRLVHDGAAWVVEEIEPHVSIRLKAIFRGVPFGAVAPFRLSGGPDLEADLLWFLARYPMRISRHDLERLRERTDLFERQSAELETILGESWTPPDAVGFRAGERPYGYQQRAAELTRRTGRLLLMDDVGLGKTVSAIATFADPAHLPAIVVPETHLTSQWAGKIAEFTELRTHVVKGTKPYKLPPHDVLICPYSRIAGWADYAQQGGYRTVAFDEIQSLRKGAETAKGLGAMAFASAAQTRIGLSATPIYNYGEEIFAVMQFIDPAALGTWPEFLTAWCRSGGGGHWIVKDPQALGAYLREQRVALRRTSADVGEERRPANVITHEIAHDAEVLAEDAALMDQLALTVMMGDFKAKGQAAREFDLRMRQATGVAKAPHVAAYVRMLVEAGRPVVLCGWHREVYDIWQARLGDLKPALYTGSETPKRKDAAKRAFCEGETDLLILSLRSGAGLDGLQMRGSTIVFGELDWSPKVHEQCIGRLNRPGQAGTVDAIYLLSDGGADPAIRSMLGLKASQSAGIVDPFAKTADRAAPDSSRIIELARSYLAQRGGAETAQAGKAAA